MQATKASVLLLTFNQELYIAEALQSLLAQNYEQLEVVISDDTSRDQTWVRIGQIVAEYQGDKRIVLNRNERNLGVVGNYFKAFSLSSGDVIFTAAGDDISLPDRCGECVKFWKESHCKDDLVATDAFDMLESGEVVGLKRTDELESWDFARWSVRRPFMFGASHMMTRRLLSLAALDSRLPFEDQSLLFRSMLMGGARRLPSALVKHRRGGLTQTAMRYDYALKKAALEKSARETLVEFDQMLSDSGRVGRTEFVLPFIEPHRHLQQFALDMLQAEGLASRLKLLLFNSKVRLDRKIRFFSFCAFPSLTSLLMNMKNTLRGRSVHSGEIKKA